MREEGFELLASSFSSVFLVDSRSSLLETLDVFSARFKEEKIIFSTRSSRGALGLFPVGETISFVATSSAGSTVDRCTDGRDRCASSTATFFASNRANRSANETDEGGMSAEIFLFEVTTFV